MPITRLEPSFHEPDPPASLIEARGEVLLSPPPLPLTPLIGRASEIGTIHNLLLQAAVRFLSLIGPGGIGKTRLAVQMSAELRSQYRDGIVFVGLATIRDPSLVLESIAESMGVRKPGDRWLTTLISDRHMLLILDNFEHVLDAAPAISTLLARCPHLTVLATSRVPLRLAGEAVADEKVDSVAGDIELLLDHGILRRPETATGEPRFRISETIREFGLDDMAAKAGSCWGHGYGNGHRISRLLPGRDCRQRWRLDLVRSRHADVSQRDLYGSE